MVLLRRNNLIPLPFSLSICQFEDPTTITQLC